MRKRANGETPAIASSRRDQAQLEDLGEERCRAPRVVATCQHPLFLLMLLLMLCWLLLALLLAGWLPLPLPETKGVLLSAWLHCSRAPEQVVPCKDSFSQQLQPALNF